MSRPLILALTAVLLTASPAWAQHAGHDEHEAPAAPPAADASCPPEHAAMGHCTSAAAAPKPETPVAQPRSGLDHSAHEPPPPADPHAGHAMPNAAPAIAPPVAPPPAEAYSGPEHAADEVWDRRLMAEKRATELIHAHGGFSGYMVLVDQLEYRAVKGGDSYAWDGQAWFGGDRDRLWLKSEGDVAFDGGLENAEVQALYSRAIGPWFNLQAGVRYDLRPQLDRAHLAVGIQGLAPYWFEIDAALFLSDRGDLTARFEAEYDQRVTNRLILQPRVEFDLAAQDVAAIGAGSGLSSLEAGLRLRYEFKREFAPYFGVQYERRLGGSAEFARAAGTDVGGWALVIGLRSWF